MWKNNEESSDHACKNRCLTRKTSEMLSNWKSLSSLLKKDCQMMASGKIFLVAGYLIFPIIICLACSLCPVLTALSIV